MDTIILQALKFQGPEYHVKKTLSGNSGHVYFSKEGILKKICDEFIFGYFNPEYVTHQQQLPLNWMLLSD